MSASVFLRISVHETMMLGTNDDSTNPRNLVYRFDDIVLKMKTEYADLTSHFPAPIVVSFSENIEETGSSHHTRAESRRFAQSLINAIFVVEVDDNKSRHTRTESSRRLARRSRIDSILVVKVDDNRSRQKRANSRFLVKQINVFGCLRYVDNLRYVDWVKDISKLLVVRVCLGLHCSGNRIPLLVIIQDNNG